MAKEYATHTHTHTHTHTQSNDGMLLSRKKNEIMPFAATWMDLEISCQVKGKSEKDKYHDTICMWNLKR